MNTLFPAVSDIPILSANGISRVFTATGGQTVTALSNVSVTASAGELVCLRGRSGSGKTTLLNILGSLDRPTAGMVIFDGTDITKLGDEARDKLRRKDMAFVFQSVALIASMTAAENVEFALRLAGAPIKGRLARAKECLARVGLDKRASHRPGELSGGEQQRVAVARAVAHKPKIIFADEPTAELDSQTGAAVVLLFRELARESGVAVVMTTHDEAIMELADRVYILEDGELTEPVQNSEN